MLLLRMPCHAEWATAERAWGSDVEQQSVSRQVCAPGCVSADGSAPPAEAPCKMCGAKHRWIRILIPGEGDGINGVQRSSSAKWISTRRFDAFAEPSVSSATLLDPARPTQSRRERSMPRATRASATA